MDNWNNVIRKFAWIGM